jgi:hypothetical protein
MDKWITKTFHIADLDNDTKDASVLMLQTMLFAMPVCVFSGIFHLVSGRIGLGGVILAEGILFLWSLFLWWRGRDSLSRIIGYYGMGLCAGIQNAIIPIESGYLIIFPLLISVSYIMFHKNEKKQRLGGSFFMITVTVVSFFVRSKFPLSAPIPSNELI